MKPLILVTDDSSFSRRHTRRLLEVLGYEVDEAVDGPDALAQLKIRRPAAVFLDLLMAGGMDGGAVLDEIRASDCTLPVIILTADVQTATEDLMRDKGATAFLNKPLSREVLAGTMAKVTVKNSSALSQPHRDRLSEVIEVGYGRAAAALASMTDQRIGLQAPAVLFSSMNEVASNLGPTFVEQAVCVNQAFSGAVSGTGMLLLDLDSARQLAAALDPTRPVVAFDEPAREMIVEAGNILVNACLGAFGNLLKVQVYFAVPRVNVDTVPGVLRTTISAGEAPPTEAVIVKTRFTVAEGQLSGMFVLLLGFAQIERVVADLERPQLAGTAAA